MAKSDSMKKEINKFLYFYRFLATVIIMSKNFILGLISFLLFYFMIPTTSFAYDISDDYSLGYKIGTNLKALSGDHDVQEYWDESQKNQLKNIKKVLVLTTINPNSIDYIGYQNTNLIV